MEISMDKSITIVQIAKESGVSIATVSRVLNGTVPVSPKTKARVEAVIEKYNYSPNTLAQGLIRRQTKTLGVIVPDITNPYFSTLFSEIERIAHQFHYSVILCNTSFTASSFHSGEKEKEKTYFQMIMDKKADGVIVAGGQLDLCQISDDYINALRRLASCIPTVLIGQEIPGIPGIFINRENARDLEIPIRYLASLGHRRIGFTGGESGVSVTEARLSVYRDTLSKLEIDTDPSLIETSDFYTSDGYLSAKKLLTIKKRPTALLAMNDYVALGALRAATDLGLSVPQDVSVVSCDAFCHSDFFTPRLTTLNRHDRRLGQYAIELLLARIQSTTLPHRPDLSPELLLRESCTSITSRPESRN